MEEDLAKSLTECILCSGEQCKCEMFGVNAAAASAQIPSLIVENVKHEYNVCKNCAGGYETTRQSGEC